MSYEYWEYGISYDLDFNCVLELDPRSSVFGDKICHRMNIRHGGLKPYGSDGYYSDHLLGEPAGSGTITPSFSNFEPSIGFEYRSTHFRWLPRERGFLVSVDARHRIVYDYHKQGGPLAPEERRWSLSVALGLSQPYGADHIPLDYFLYFYRGVNPHGQLRSDGDYTFVGLGFVFGN